MNIAITGKGSYIGICIKKHLEKAGFVVDEIDTIGNEWKETDFSKYDTVVHVAAIVHDNAKNATEDLFKRVNIDLACDIAEKAKHQGVGQFVFISTMAVFGVEKTLKRDEGIVFADSPLNPSSLYGKSKLEAEKKLLARENDNFRISIVRPPNVYGPGCKGNYIYLLKKLSDAMFICPYAYEETRQSMLYIDNLSELIKLIIENSSSGVFMPQDDVAPNMVELVASIRAISGKKTRYSKLLGKCLKIMAKLSIVKKIYGGVCYENSFSNSFDYKYRIVTFDEGLKKTYNK